MAHRILFLGLSFFPLACAASTGDETENGAEPNVPTTIDAGTKPLADAKLGGSASGSDASTGIVLEAGSAGCTPGEIVGTAHITNTCYLDCLNACMTCDSPTGEATCGPFNHAGHAPYCGTMQIIVCPPGTHGDRTHYEGQYFPGTQHYANETYSCICDEKEGAPNPQ